MVGWTSRLKKLSNKQRMKTNEQLLEEIYSHFPESEDKDETLCNLITDSIAAIGFWNTKARPWSSVMRTTSANSISPI